MGASSMIAPGEHALRSEHAWATVSTTAGMLLDAGFALESGPFSPFARAPWSGAEMAAADATLPGHLRVLAGEFVAVPFGSADVPPDAPDPWAAFSGMRVTGPPHGLSADADWTVVEANDSRLVLALDYPDGDAVSRLERTIAVDPAAPALRFELAIFARRAVSIPVGLHPILRLPDEVGRLELSVGFDRGYSYPWTLVPGASRIAPGRSFAPLDDAGASRYPSGAPTEDVVLLAGATSPVIARYESEGAEVVIDWDRTLLPSVLIWHSDRALGDEPWNHSYRGLGVEPVAAAFDLPAEVSAAPNPISSSGYATTVAVSPDAPTVISYSIAARSVGTRTATSRNETHEARE